MGFRGDLGKMGELEDALRDLAEVPSRASAGASETIALLVDKQFSEGADPYGNPWEPLADSTLAQGRSPPPLTDTGSLRSGISVEPMRGAGIRITIDDAEVASYHQTGTANMPARPILPDEGMPDDWERALREATEEAYMTKMRGVPGVRSK